MKKHKRKKPLFSTLVFAIAAMCALTVQVISVVLSGEIKELFIIFGALSFLMIWVHCILNIAAFGSYGYNAEGIELFFGYLKYKKLNYSIYDFALISNASYNNGYGVWDYLMQYKIKDKKRNLYVTFPFVTLHKNGYPLNEIKSGMSSNKLCYLGREETYCLGICWFDSLEELLRYSNYNIYILEDVYLRYKGMFDSVILKNTDRIKCVTIVADKLISYLDYTDKSLHENS